MVRVLIVAVIWFSSPCGVPGPQPPPPSPFRISSPVRVRLTALAPAQRMRWSLEPAPHSPMVSKLELAITSDEPEQWVSVSVDNCLREVLIPEIELLAAAEGDGTRELFFHNPLPGAPFSHGGEMCVDLRLIQGEGEGEVSVASTLFGEGWDVEMRVEVEPEDQD